MYVHVQVMCAHRVIDTVLRKLLYVFIHKFAMKLRANCVINETFVLQSEKKERNMEEKRTGKEIMEKEREGGKRGRKGGRGKKMVKRVQL